MNIELAVNTPTIWHELGLETVEGRLEETYSRTLTLTIPAKQTLVNQVAYALAQTHAKQCDVIEKYLRELADAPPTDKEEKTLI